MIFFPALQGTQSRISIALDFDRSKRQITVLITLRRDSFVSGKTFAAGITSSLYFTRSEITLWIFCDCPLSPAIGFPTGHVFHGGEG